MHIRGFKAAFNWPSWNPRKSRRSESSTDEDAFLRDLALPKETRQELLPHIAEADRPAFVNAMRAFSGKVQSIRIVCAHTLSDIPSSDWPRTVGAVQALAQSDWSHWEYRTCLRAFARLPEEKTDSILAAAMHLRHTVTDWIGPIYRLESLPPEHREATALAYAALVKQCPAANRGGADDILDALGKLGPKRAARAVQGIAGLYRSHTVSRGPADGYAKPTKVMEDWGESMWPGLIRAMPTGEDMEAFVALIKRLDSPRSREHTLALHVLDLAKTPVARREAYVDFGVRIRDRLGAENALSFVRQLAQIPVDKYATFLDCINELLPLLDDFVLDPEPAYEDLHQLSDACLAAVQARAKLDSATPLSAVMPFKSAKPSDISRYLTSLSNVPTDNMLQLVEVLRVLGAILPDACDQKVYERVIQMSRPELDRVVALGKRLDGGADLATTLYDEFCAGDALPQQWTNLPLRVLWPMRDHLLAEVRRRHPDVVAALDNKGFDANAPEHRKVAFIMLLATPHGMKAAHADDLCYATWVDAISDPKEPPELDPGEVDAARYIGYEAHRLYEDFVKPAKEKAKALNVPLMLVANVTYGGSVATALPLRQLQREGVRVVFTKQGSSEAHTDPHCLNPNLFSGETLDFIAQRKPLVLVLDGSHNNRFPDAFRGYRNFVALLNEAQGITDFGWLQKGLNRRAFVPRSQHDGLQQAMRRAMQGSAQQPYGLHFAALRGKLETGFDEKPKPFKLKDMHTSGMICIETSIPRPGYPTAPLDDNDQAQGPNLRAGRYGAKLKPALHRYAREAFKWFQRHGAKGWVEPPATITRL